MSTRSEFSKEAELRARIMEIESQLTSQHDLGDLIQSLASHQDELRTQQASLIEAQRALEDSRDRYVELYDFAPIPIVTLSTSGALQGMNLAAARLLGVDRSNAIGMPMMVYAIGDSRRSFLDHMARCRREQGMVRSEISVRGRGQAPVPVEIQSRRFEPAGGAGVVYLSVLVDLTERLHHEEERRRLAEERERSRREELAARAASEAKDHFLAVLSHELRTPLSPILLTLDMLDEHAGPSPLVRNGFAMIRRNAEFLAHLIDDLLDVTRIAHDKLHLTTTPTALNATLNSVVELCSAELEKMALAMDVELEAGDLHVLGDPLRLRQIFWNLLKNAIEHSPPRGRVTMRAEAIGERAVRVSIRNDGEGIEPDEIERLFEPFHQAKKASPGLGLGLAICRGLVEAHGGTIHAVSPGMDAGATFVVELPTCPAPPPDETHEGRREQKPKHHRVLVIEDHADTGDAMQIVLERRGYHVRLARSLADGRRLSREPFDVLVSDLQLPDGSGLDLMRELAATGPVKGIAMSGFGTASDVRRSREAGFEHHLVKPVEIQSVIDAIESFSRD